MARRKGQTTGRCITCQHPRRPEIEQAICRGATTKGTAAKYGLNPFAVRRHMLNHVSAEARAEYAVGADVEKLGELVVEENNSVLQHYAAIRARLYRHLDVAGEANDRINIDRLAGRLHENLHHVSRITGELQRSPLLVQQHNIIGGDNARVIAAIVAAVAPYPEARIAVTQALRRLEQPDQPPLLEHANAD